jgi:Glycosyl hydrolase family 12
MLAPRISLPAALAAILGAALMIGGCAKPSSGGGTGSGGTSGTGKGGTTGTTCATGQKACSQGCTNVQTDSQNCGTCSTVCGAGQTCQSGTCTCSAGLLNCAGSCVSSDATHCGNCTMACTGTTPMCSNNACSAGCATGQTACSAGACANLQTDNGNCGTCGKVCSGGSTCNAGSCTCSVTGQQLCGTACADTTSNTSNCGSCGHACTTGQTCTNSACVTVSTTGTAGTTGSGSAGTTGSGTAGTSGTGTAGTTGKGGSGGKGGTGATVVDAGADVYPCTNTDMSLLPIDESGFVQERCNTYGIQGAWYCYADTTLPGGSASNNGSSNCKDHVVPYVAASNGMCLSGVTSTTSGAYGAALGLELNTPGAVGGVDQTKQAYNASTHNVYGFEITITAYNGATDNYALRLTWTTGAATTVTQPFVDLPGPGTYDVYFADAVVPGSFSDTSAGMRLNSSAIYDIQLAIPKEGSTAVTYGFCITKLKPITTPPTAPTACGTLANYGGPICGNQDLLGEVGNYGVQNNVSGTGTQCIQAKSGGGCAGFTITSGNVQSPSFPAAYPSVIYGWQAGSFYGAYKTAKTLSSITTAPASWTFTTPSGGSSDTSFDIWLHPTNAAPKTADGGLELMIWMNSAGGIHPAGSEVMNGGTPKTVTIGPGTWNIYTGSISINGATWDYLAYLATSTYSVNNMDLKAFFNDAKTESLPMLNNKAVTVADSWYLLGIQAGFEVTGTSGGSVNSFSVSTN